MKIQKSKEFFYGKTSNVHEEYDLSNAEERKESARIIISFFLPLVLLIPIAIYFLGNTDSVIVPVVLIFVSVFASLILTCNAVIYNKEHSTKQVDPIVIENTKGIRSIVVIIILCATYIPFLPYIFSLMFARKYPNYPLYNDEEFNVQKFTLLWSVINLFTFILIYVLYVNTNGFTN